MTDEQPPNHDDSTSGPEGAPPPAPATWPAAPEAQAPETPAVPPPAAPAVVAAPPTSSNAIVALILAIVSWAVCPIVPAIVALVLAQSASREIAASQGRVQGAGLVTAARIVSWINIGFWTAFIVIGLFVVLLAAVAGS